MPSRATIADRATVPDRRVIADRRVPAHPHDGCRSALGRNDLGPHDRTVSARSGRSSVMPYRRIGARDHPERAADRAGRSRGFSEPLVETADPRIVVAVTGAITPQTALLVDQVSDEATTWWPSPFGGDDQLGMLNHIDRREARGGASARPRRADVRPGARARRGRARLPGALLPPDAGHDRPSLQRRRPRRRTGSTGSPSRSSGTSSSARISTR